MSKSKPGFSIYSPSVHRFKKILIKAGQKSAKKASFTQLASDVFNLPHSSNLDKHLMVAEVLWDHDGRNVVFPGDSEFFHKLMASKFSLEHVGELNLPYSSFILAMPKGFVVDGVEIPSVVVSHHKASDRESRYDLANNLMAVPLMAHEENNLAGSDSLSFFYQDPYEQEGVIVQVNQTPAHMGAALKSDSANEYADILGAIPKDLVSPVAMDPSSTDHIIQYVLTKIIAGISVYLSATNTDRLKTGLPYNGRLSISNLKTDVRYSFSHLPSHSLTDDIDGTMVMTTRSFHFRQLRAAKYYQNEHKHKPAGSRWVFVNEAQVGHYKASHIE